MKRYGVIALIVLVLTGTGCVLLRTCWARMASSIPSTGGKEWHIRLKDVGTTFLQKDERWAAERLGPSSGTLGSHGCLVCSVAMACVDLGVELTPKELNESLMANEGFLPQGWVVWNAMPAATDGRVTAAYHRSPSHAVMDAALEQGGYPVVKYFLLGGIQHWCVIVGKEGLEYLARDPLHDEKEPVRLSTLTEKIYAVRVIGRAGE